MNRATGKPNLDQALKVWADPMRTWPRLYRLLEEIEGHLGKSANAAGLCSGKERTRFRQTAESPEVAGVDARQASGNSIRLSTR